MSDFLPTLVRICEERIYQLCLSAVPAVRFEAVCFINVFLHQAVTNPVDAMPTLIALLFDGKSQQTARQALHVLLSLAEKKKEYLSFIEQKVMAGIRLGYALQPSLWTADAAEQFDPLDARLSDGATNTQIPFEHFAQLYGMLKRSAVQRKQIAHNLVHDIMAGQLAGEVALNAPIAPFPESSATQPLNRSHAPPPPDRSPLDTPPLRNTPELSPVPPLSPAFVNSALASQCPSGGSPRDKFGFLCHVGRLLLHLPFDDDEPLHLSFHLSRLINTRGATLLATMEQRMQDAQQAGSALSGEQLTGLAALADGGMAVCVLVRVRQALIVSYALEGRLGEWSIANATAKNAVKCSRKSDEQLSFHSFPFAHDTITPSIAASPINATAAAASANATVGSSAPAPPAESPQSGQSPTGKSARSSTSATHSRANSVAASSTHSPDAAASTGTERAIPPLLMAQYSFFAQQMAEAAVFMQTGGGSATAGKPSGRKAVRGRQRRRRRDDNEDGTDDDNNDDSEKERTPQPTAARSTPAKKASGGRGKAAKRASSGTPQKKRRKRLTFSDKDVTAEADDDDDDDNDDGDWDGN